MADTIDTDKIVAAILAAAQVSQTEDQSTGRYLDAYAEMSRAMKKRQEEHNTAWIEAFKEAASRQGGS